MAEVVFCVDTGRTPERKSFPGIHSSIHRSQVDDGHSRVTAEWTIHAMRLATWDNLIKSWRRVVTWGKRSRRGKRIWNEITDPYLPYKMPFCLTWWSCNNNESDVPLTAKSLTQLWDWKLIGTWSWIFFTWYNFPVKGHQHTPSPRPMDIEISRAPI